MENLLRIGEPVPRGRRFALWDLGFRPFYLLASAFSALSIALWALQFAGLLTHPYLQGALWHAHEMLFGFALAVVVGFLLTAGRNWTNRPTLTGPGLAALVTLWVAGRVLVLTPFAWTAAIVNTAFPLAAAAALAVPFVAARNRRNYFFVGLLVLMAAAQWCFHMSELGVLRLPAWTGIRLALDVLLFIVAVMAGRVVPMFTNNGVPGAGATRHVLGEKIALGSILLLFAADAVQLHGPAMATLAGIGAGAHLLRWLQWRPWKTGRVPLVWVLHVAYGWVPVHLLLRAFAEQGWVAASLAIHALTVGVVGGLIIGMMTRTARGHTARPLQTDRVEVTSFVLVLLAAPLRVLVPALLPAFTLTAILASATLWCAGFALYAVHYWPVLTRPRLDGKPG